MERIYNVPQIKDIETAATVFVYYFKLAEHVKIEEEYLGRPTTNEEKMKLIVEFMLDQEHFIKENYECTRDA